MGLGKKGVLVGVLIVALGAAWLLNTLHFIGGVDWIWTISLAAVGLIALGWTKINKMTFLVGTFLLVGSVFSIFRQTGFISVDVEVPLLVIAFGLLFLVAQLPLIPVPPLIARVREEEKKHKSGA